MFGLLPRDQGPQGHPRLARTCRVQKSIRSLRFGGTLSGHLVYHISPVASVVRVRPTCLLDQLVQVPLWYVHRLRPGRAEDTSIQERDQ